jgi:hypothetical protein
MTSSAAPHPDRFVKSTLCGLHSNGDNRQLVCGLRKAAERPKMMQVVPLLEGKEPPAFSGQTIVYFINNLF